MSPLADDLKLKDWQPKSQLVVKETKTLRPKFPVIDFHNHLGHLDRTARYLAEMDKAGVVQCVSLDGRSRDGFYQKHLEASQTVAKDRFLVFFSPDWSKIDEPDFGEAEAQKLEEAVRLGARGLKIGKNLGLTLKDKTGQLVPVDDPRLDPLWARCGALGIPVMIHVTDPKAFFDPLDEHNERIEKLALHPDWSFYGEPFPKKEEILDQRNRVLAKHPGTTFVGAHVGNLPEELHQVSLWLDLYPNLYVDISARTSELGRQPYTARRFMIKYRERILFGTDDYPNAEGYFLHYRFLETDDEYFPPLGGQCRWRIYGLFLPDHVLEMIYNKNARRILDRFKPGE